MTRRREQLRDLPPVADPVLLQRLQASARRLADQRGWSASSLNRTLLGLEVLLSHKHPPQNPFTNEDLTALTSKGLHSVNLVATVLTSAGLLQAPEGTSLDAFYRQRSQHLPSGIRGELDSWFAVMRHGSNSPPRRTPRSDTTIRLKLRYLLPSLDHWAGQGHVSLREISREDVLATLPPNGNDRALTGTALRSLFTVLKGRKLLFTNPARGIATGSAERRQPLPIDPAAVRALLNSADPTQAAAASLIAFHGLRSGQVRRLQLTDLDGQRLRLEGHDIPLAAPVRQCLTEHLDERARRWPKSANPHLFINGRTASNLQPVGDRWLTLRLGMPARALRDDRLLEEVLHGGGDVRRLVDLFDVSVKTAQRYVNVLEHPELRT